MSGESHSFSARLEEDELLAINLEIFFCRRN